ncbi:unnamed protein product, partial [marine sediment metagenome]
MDRLKLEERIKQLTHPQCFFVNTKCSPQRDSVDLETEGKRQGCIRCRSQTDQLLALYPDEQEIRKLREKITELDKKLNDREEDLITAKREERERMRIWGNERCLDHHTSMNNIA